MPKTLSATAITEKNTAQGTKPSILIRLTVGVSQFWYGEKAFTLAPYTVEARIKSVSGVTSELRQDSLGTAGTCNLELIDYDDYLKALFDGAILENCFVDFFQYFQGFVVTDLIHLFSGRIIGPLVWSEGNKILKLNTEINVNNRELGYSISEDDIPGLNPDAYNVPWPMIFGTANHVPAVHVIQKAKGTLIYPIKLTPDPLYTINSVTNAIVLSGTTRVWSDTGSWVVDKIYIRDGDRFPSGTIQINVDGVIFEGSFDTDNITFNVTSCNLPLETNVELVNLVPDPDEKNQLKLKNDRISLIGKNIWLDAAAGYYRWNYCIKQEGKLCTFVQQFRNPTTGVFATPTTANTIPEVRKIDKSGLIADQMKDVYDNINHQWMYATANKRIPFRNKMKARLDKLESSGQFWGTDADTEVWQHDGNPDTYIFSWVQCSSVQAVFGKRTTVMNGKSVTILSPIPSTYYTIDLTSDYEINGQYASAVLFPKSLISYNEGWTGEVYVSATSTLGPNPITIISTVLDQYTDLTIDSTSFGLVTAQFVSQPTNFAYFQKIDALKFCQELAWQCRCILLMDAAEVKIVYLDEIKSSVTTFSEDNTVEKSLNLSTTPASSLITRLVGKYDPSYANVPLPNANYQTSKDYIKEILRIVTSMDKNKKSKIVMYQNNIDLYGLRDEEVDLFAFTTEVKAQIPINFWGAWKSVPWRRVSLTTCLNALNLEVMDYVTLIFDKFTGTGYVEAIKYDPVACLIELDIRTTT